MQMGLKHKEYIEKAEAFLKELVPSATEISFEEFGTSLPIENPPNAAIVVLSYKDSKNKEGMASLFSKKLKAIYMDPNSGELLSVKNMLG